MRLLFLIDQPRQHSLTELVRQKRKTRECKIRFNILSEDINAVRNYLAILNTGELYSDFKDIFDLDNIGLLGHSGGGGTVIIRAFEDKDIKAVVALDPAIRPLSDKLLSRDMGASLFITMSEEWQNDKRCEKLDILMKASRNKVYAYEIDDINHADYAMIDYISPLAKMISNSGGFLAREGEKLLKEAVLSFFDECFKGTASRLEEIADSTDKIRFYSNSVEN
ncbi:hypothetical protein [Kosmotoga pacifica]|uniref:alpha/beta hydrolase n=1 Tax=Kosmotoga pacifica TaxID=1330330 RepID=UPI001C54CAAF|nr:hypothetical protein [Kosmotoga pacifica]